MNPSSGFTSTDLGKPMRIAITGGTNVVFGTLGLSPNALFMTQGNQSQVVIGADLKYFVTNTTIIILQLHLGYIVV